MAVFQWVANLFTGWLGGDTSAHAGGWDQEMSAGAQVINPATGLPMIDGIESVDVAGNAYGTDMSVAEDTCACDDGSADGWNDDATSSWDDCSSSGLGGFGSSWD